MLAGLGLLRSAVFAMADRLLAARAENAGRSVTDAEVVTLAVAQAVMDVRRIASRRRVATSIGPRVAFAALAARPRAEAIV